LRSAFLAPQITIAQVADAVWREAVSAVAAESPAALIDISEPTEHLEWEIAHLRETGRAFVFIAERERLQSWMAASDDRRARVREWVGEDAVLVYGAGSRAEGRRFRRQLGNALARAAASTERKRSAPLAFRLWVQEFGRSYAYYGFWVLVAVLTSEALGGVL
jgi:hypothetical protein